MKTKSPYLRGTCTDDCYELVHAFFTTIYRLDILHTTHSYVDIWQSTDDFIYKFVWYNDRTAG